MIVWEWNGNDPLTTRGRWHGRLGKVVDVDRLLLPY